MRTDRQTDTRTDMTELTVAFRNFENAPFTKIRPVGIELSHVDRQTDMTELTVAFRNFENARKKN